MEGAEVFVVVHYKDMFISIVVRTREVVQTHLHRSRVVYDAQTLAIPCLAGRSTASLQKRLSIALV